MCGLGGLLTCKRVRTTFDCQVVCAKYGECFDAKCEGRNREGEHEQKKADMM